MKQIKYLLIMLVALLVSANSADAQKMITKDLSHLGSFDRIHASVGWEITFKQSNTTSIVVSYSEDATDRVRVRIVDGKLILGLDNGRRKNNKRLRLRAEISAPSLRAINMTTSAEIKFVTPLTLTNPLDIDVTTAADIKGLVLNAPSLKVNITTSADMDADIQVDKLDVDCTTSADITLTGTANYASLVCTTSGDIIAKGLKCIDANCRATTSGDISVTVTDTLTAKSTTSGDIVVYGNPKNTKIHHKGIHFK